MAWHGILPLVKEPERRSVKGHERRTFSPTRNLGFSLPIPPRSRLLIPLTYARVVVLAMRVAGIRSRALRAALGKIRDPNYWDETIAISKCDTYEVDISSRPIYATSVLSVNWKRGLSYQRAEGRKKKGKQSR